MTDKLNQLGKSLGQMRSDNDSALIRHQPIVPTIERARDVFDFNTPFEMHFKVEPNHRRMELDLIFQKPPPYCLGGEWALKCDEFDFVGGGSHLVQTVIPYQLDSISVFVNEIQLEDSKIEQVDPSTGQVYFVYDGTDDIVVNVCYFFGCNCQSSGTGFGDLTLRTYFEFAPPDVKTSPLVNVVLDGNTSNGYTFGAGLFFPENGVGFADRGWNVNYSCGKTFRKINLLRTPDDGITQWPENLWLDGVLTDKTVVGSYTSLPDKPLGWQQWILPHPVTATQISIGKRYYYDGTVGRGFTFFAWMRLSEVVFLD